MHSTICKIVYFDEASVTDYVQIVAGGELQKTTELLEETYGRCLGQHVHEYFWNCCDHPCVCKQ